MKYSDDIIKEKCSELKVPYRKYTTMICKRVVLCFKRYKENG